jgi:hypothetical protein
MASQLVTLQVRRGTEAGSTGWFQVNPRLTAGEPGFASDTGALKIGNGIDLWNNLPSINSPIFVGPTGSVLYYSGTSVTGSTSILGISGSALSTSLSIVPIGGPSLGVPGSTWSALYSGSIIDSVGSSGSANQVLTSGIGGVLTWGPTASGEIQFSGPTGSVLYYNGTSVTGTTGLQYLIGGGITMDVLAIRGLNTSVAIGQDTGSTGIASIAIGPQAGQGQLTNAIAIGNGAGQISQAFAAIAIGSLAASSGQKTNAIAIGPYAGNINQGADSIAIGRLAGSSGQAANTIILNASGSALDGGGQTGCFYVNPIRSAGNQVGQTSLQLFYNQVTGEIFSA